MISQLAGFVASLVTMVTVKCFFLSVDSFMISQLTTFLEILVTVVTVEWFFTHMGHSMLTQLIGLDILSLLA